MKICRNSHVCKCQEYFNFIFLALLCSGIWISQIDQLPFFEGLYGPHVIMKLDITLATGPAQYTVRCDLQTQPL